jgi:tRNA-guanine family transglycosylase
LQRFGTALVDTGQLALRQRIFEADFTPIDAACECYTCKNYTRAYLHTIVNREAVASQLLSIHNVAFQVRHALHFVLYFLLCVLQCNHAADIDDTRANKYH